MKPYVICHMVSSLDGRTDGDSLDAVMPEGEYEATANQLGGNAWMCGRVTMQEILDDDDPFVSSTDKPAGPQPVFVARQADSYAVCVDTLGKLRWTSGDLRGDHLICLLSERVPPDYLTLLRKKTPPSTVAGAASVALAVAMNQLGKHFGIRTLLLEGGGHINSAFLQAGLIDEISLLLVPGVDGRPGTPTVFDGMKLTGDTAIPLKLKSVEQRPHDTFWLRYTVTHG